MIIRYSSNIDFENDNEFMPMTVSKEWQIEGRLIPYHVAPVPVEDNWNGQPLTIHQTNWDHYTFTININSAQTKMLGNILMCKNVVIEDAENDLTVTLDTSLSTHNTFDVGELIGETSNFQVIVKCRGNITYVNRQEPTQQLYKITIDSVIYYTDNIPVTLVPASELNEETDNDGLTPSSSSDYKKVIKFVFYKNEADRNTLKTAFEGTKASLITCFDGTTTFPLLQNSIIEGDVDALAYDFYKMVVPCVIDADRKYFN